MMGDFRSCVYVWGGAGRSLGLVVAVSGPGFITVAAGAPK